MRVTQFKPSHSIHSSTLHLSSLHSRFPSLGGMPRRRHLACLVFLFLFLFPSGVQPGYAAANANASEIETPAAAAGGHHQAHSAPMHLEKMKKQRKTVSRRMGIGSMAPNCTYNECRGCKYRCRAQQVPVDANDPLNSPYRYKCVCVRS